MYAVIRTGGKQYRVQPGDVLVVEKLPGEAGSKVQFDQVLAHGGGGAVTLGAPLVDGAVVHATLIETRKGEKVKIFKKIRRQGYRRTRGHRQTETVLRVTGLELGGKTLEWDGEVKLDTKALINAKARGLKHEIAALEGSSLVPAVVEETPTKKKSSPKKAVAEEAHETPDAAVEAPAVETPAVEAEAPKPAKAKAAPKVEDEAEPAEHAAAEEAAPKKKAAPKAKAEAETVEDAASETAAPKKKAAPKAKPASDDAE